MVSWTGRRIDRKFLMFSQRRLNQTKEHFDGERIQTWFRNHKNKKKGGGARWGGVVLKVRDRSHLSHGEIVLVTNDDDILEYKS